MNAIAEDEEIAPAEHRRHRFRIEPNIRLGEILVLVTMVIGGTSAYYANKAQVDQNARDIQTMQVTQRDRDATQDASVSRVEVYLKDGIQQIRIEQAEIRREVGEIGRYVRNKGG